MPFRLKVNVTFSLLLESTFQCEKIRKSYRLTSLSKTFPFHWQATQCVTSFIGNFSSGAWRIITLRMNADEKCLSSQMSNEGREESFANCSCWRKRNIVSRRLEGKTFLRRLNVSTYRESFYYFFNENLIPLMFKSSK